MPRAAGKTSLSVLMSREELERVNELALSRGFAITADYVRALIEQDAAAAGRPMAFDVDRGRYRPRREKPAT